MPKKKPKLYPFPVAEKSDPGARYTHDDSRPNWILIAHNQGIEDATKGVKQKPALWMADKIVFVTAYRTGYREGILKILKKRANGVAL